MNNDLDWMEKALVLAELAEKQGKYLLVLF
jgi:hypothetical protein